jgi:hypothetical protein
VYWGPEDGLSELATGAQISGLGPEDLNWPGTVSVLKPEVVSSELELIASLCVVSEVSFPVTGGVLCMYVLTS